MRAILNRLPNKPAFLATLWKLGLICAGIPALTLGCDFSTPVRSAEEIAAARQAEEAAPLQAAAGRIQRVSGSDGSELRIEPETGEPLVLKDTSIEPQAGGGGEYWTLKAAYTGPDLVCLEKTGGENPQYFLIDMKTGQKSEIGGVPVFSPDRERFATANHPPASATAYFKVWRIEDSAPLEERAYAVQVGSGKALKFKVKWQSPRRVTFEEIIKLGDSPTVMPMTINLVEGRWMRETP